MRVFVDLETNAKSRFLNHGDPRVWFLTDLEKGAIQEHLSHFLYASMIGSIVVFNAMLYNTLKMADAHGKITFKPLRPSLGWKCSKSLNLD